MHTYVYAYVKTNTHQTEVSHLHTNIYKHTRTHTHNICIYIYIYTHNTHTHTAYTHVHEYTSNNETQPPVEDMHACCMHACTGMLRCELSTTHDSHTHAHTCTHIIVLTASKITHPLVEGQQLFPASIIEGVSGLPLLLGGKNVCAGLECRSAPAPVKANELLWDPACTRAAFTGK
jgi:hypothetical protein